MSYRLAAQVCDLVVTAHFVWTDAASTRTADQGYVDRMHETLDKREKAIDAEIAEIVASETAKMREEHKKLFEDRALSKL